MNDQIFVRDLEVDTIIGIFDWERTTRQTVSIDLTMPADIRLAASRDHIDDTLNYKAVAEDVVALVAASSFQLVETMAERIAEVCLTGFGLPWVEVRVNKPGAIDGAKDVGVHIRRGWRGAGLSHTAHVALSSALSPATHLPAMVDALKARYGGISASPVYENPDVDGGDALYWNQVVGLETDESPAALAAALNAMATPIRRGRDITALGLRVLLHGSTVSTGHVTLPHPDLARHACILRPLAELIGHQRHPITGMAWSAVLAGAELSAHPMNVVSPPATETA